MEIKSLTDLTLSALVSFSHPQLRKQVIFLTLADGSTFEVYTGVLDAHSQEIKSPLQFVTRVEDAQ